MRMAFRPMCDHPFMIIHDDSIGYSYHTRDELIEMGEEYEDAAHRAILNSDFNAKIMPKGFVRRVIFKVVSGNRQSLFAQKGGNIIRRMDYPVGCSVYAPAGSAGVFCFEDDISAEKFRHLNKTGLSNSKLIKVEPLGEIVTGVMIYGDLPEGTINYPGVKVLT